jgi:mannosyltransferase
MISSRHRLALAGLTALALLLRLATVDLQSFWADEVVTVNLLHLDLGAMLRAIPDSEGSPPGYYVIAWGWTHVFGTGETGIRSLSALAGAAAIPVFYGAARELCSPRVGLGVAALAAVNPILIWYSQEARAYSLMVLFGALTLWSFAYALKRPGWRPLALWAASSALTIATHYFAAYLVAAEAVWLVGDPRTRRRAAPAVGAVALVGLALLPLLEHQAKLGVGSWIASTGSLPYRVGRAAKQFILGFDAPLENAAAIAGVALSAVGIFLAAVTPERGERRGLWIAAALGAAAIGLPLILAIAGHDYFEARNLLVAWLPVAIVVTGGLLSRRAGAWGVVILGTLCVLEATAVIAVFLEPGWQREDWRGAARQLGPAEGARAVVVQPASGVGPMKLYLSSGSSMPPASSVREVDLVATVARTGRGVHPDPPPRSPPPSIPGFQVVERDYTDSYTVIRFRARSPQKVSIAELIGKRLNPSITAAALVLSPG